MAGVSCKGFGSKGLLADHAVNNLTGVSVPGGLKLPKGYKRNPIGRKRPAPRKPRTALIANYKEPIARLRSLGIDPLPGVPLTAIKSVKQIPESTRKNITKLYSRYDYLFSRPHIVADFSLPESKVREEYQAWKDSTVRQLAREGFSKKEITAAMRQAGDYQEFRKARVKQNDERKLAAQEFAGHHILDKNLKAAIIPVITGAPKNVRLKFGKDGRPFLREKNVDTYDVKLDPYELAKGKRKYLEKALASFGERDRFLIVTGDYMTVGNSGAKERMIERVLRMMGKYHQKAITKGRDKGRANPHYWKNWLIGIRVLRGKDETDVESARQGFEALRQKMKRERIMEANKLNTAKQDLTRKQNRDRQRRKRVRDNFLS